MNQLPTKDQIRQWIAENPGLVAKRDIAKAFGIKGDAKIDLKRILREMEDEGALEKKARRFQEPGVLPPVAVLQILAPDAAGDLFAVPLEDGVDSSQRVLIVTQKGDPALGAGDRILGRLTPVKGEGHAHEGRLIRRLGSNPLKVLGIYRDSHEGGRIVPIDKGQDKEWRVARDASNGARDGELVEGEAVGNRRMGLPQARIVARLGDPSGARAVSLIAIHQHGIPDQFPDPVIAEADKAAPVGLQGREDLRDLPLVTIDPIDARDRDDAVYAMADDQPGNPGGHIIWVAIADVAHYVRPGSPLDREARKRGNSTYFPDRVVPMLPEILSADVCSLKEGEDRAAMACHLHINADGTQPRFAGVRIFGLYPVSGGGEALERRLSELFNEVDAVIRQGKRFIVLEARDRIGGRAFTDTATLGLPFDGGAHWLHAAAQNPFKTIADRLGYFASEGVDVDVRDFADSAQAMQALLSGAAHALSAPYSSAIAWQMRGQSRQFGAKPHLWAGHHPQFTGGNIHPSQGRLVAHFSEGAEIVMTPRL